MMMREVLVSDLFSEDDSDESVEVNGPSWIVHWN
jgi:hypothetical protein